MVYLFAKSGTYKACVKPGCRPSCVQVQQEGSKCDCCKGAHLHPRTFTCAPSLTTACLLFVLQAEGLWHVHAEKELQGGEVHLQPGTRLSFETTNMYPPCILKTWQLPQSVPAEFLQVWIRHACFTILQSMTPSGFLMLELGSGMCLQPACSQAQALSCMLHEFG